MLLKKLILFCLVIALSNKVFSVEKCALCLNEITQEKINLYKDEKTREESNIEILSRCNHIFCRDCIFKWFRSKLYLRLSCPLCRKKYNVNELNLNISDLELNDFRKAIVLFELLEVRYFPIVNIYNETFKLINLNILKNKKTSEDLEKIKEKKFLLDYANLGDLNKKILFLENKKEGENELAYLKRKFKFLKKTISIGAEYEALIVQQLKDLKDLLDIDSEDKRILEQVYSWFKELQDSWFNVSRLFICTHRIQQESSEIQSEFIDEEELLITFIVPDSIRTNQGIRRRGISIRTQSPRRRRDSNNDENSL